MRKELIWGACIVLVMSLFACQVDNHEPDIAADSETTRSQLDFATTTQYPDDTKIHILQWNHFVPQYDRWFDPFAQVWGDSVNVDVSVEHIGLGRLPDALTAAIEAGEGPSLVELVIGAATFVEDVHDLTDVNLAAQEMFGKQAQTCHANSYLPTTGKYYAFCSGWTPDPGDYNITLWTEVGYPDGPATWEALLEGGHIIREQTGVAVGIGFSAEMDSEMAQRDIIWSFGGAIQDENEHVVINSPEVIAAVEYMAQLYRETAHESVFDWDPASNNQGLISGELSYILNSVSAYRSLQKVDPEAADNIGFVAALQGPNGHQYASAHVWSLYVIPNYVQGAELEAAKAFLLHLTHNYNQAVFNSELYNFPAFAATAPDLFAEDGWLNRDPFGSRPADKLAVLQSAEQWTTHLGFPGVAHPAVAEIFFENIITDMVKAVALDEMTAEEAVAHAEIEIEAIFEKWQDKGFVRSGTTQPVVQE